MIKKITGVMWAVLVLSVVSTAQTGEHIAAKILSLQGLVEVEQSPWASAEVDQILYAGNRIRTGPRSRAALLLADETQVKLSANSELELTTVRPASNLLVRVAQAGARTDQSILRMDKGRAWMRSKKTPAAVQIRTPAVTAAIRGTEFDLQVADDGETFTTVVEGSVDFSNDLGTVVVNPGEQGRCRVGEAPTKIVILNPEDAVQWTLFYSAAVSPRDFPFIYSSVEQARANLDGSGSNAVRSARIQHDAGDLEAALELLSGIVSPEAAETRGWIYLEQNRIGEAIQELGTASADSPRTRLGFSVAHYRMGEFQEAYRYVENPGDDSRLKVQRAMLDLLTGDVESARALLDSIASDEPAYSMAQGLLSNVFLTQNDKDQALAVVERAVQANPASPSAHLNLSLVQQSFFDLPAATDSAETALDLDPHFIQARVQYAKLLFGAGNTKKAGQVIEQALADAPQEAAVQSTLGFILLARGESSEARVHLERSIQLDSTRGEPRLGLGIVDMRRGQAQDAVLQILEATTLEPQISLYQSYLGKAFYAERKFEQAFTALEAAMELDPRDPTPHLYSGIFQEELNRPSVAVEDFQESIRLNDNRAVYRSRFVLDEDRATRNIKLASAFNRLGFSESANLEAIKSFASDPTNSSSRIFLADTFLRLPGRSGAAGSELLMARLLLPVNANSFNAFNDYTTLFELPRLNWTGELGAGNLDTYNQSLVASGGMKRVAFGSIFSHDRTDGFRPVNDDARTYTTVNLFKFATTAHSDLLLSYSHTQTKEGDRGFSNFLVTPENDENRRLFSRTNRAEIGYHHQLNPGSEVLVYFSGRTNEQILEDLDFIQPGNTPFGVPIALRRSSLDPNVSLQATHLLKVSNLQFKYGFDLFDGRSRTRDVLTFEFPGSDPPEFISDEFDLTRGDTQYRTVFLQGDYIVNPMVVFTAGLNYDWANDNNLFDDEQISMNSWNPQAGFLVTPFEDTTVRFGFSRNLQTHNQERVIPTHLFGFPLGLNEFELTRSTGFNLGWDQRLFEGKTFLRTTGFFRDRTIPTTQGAEILDFEGDFYGGQFVVQQSITEVVTAKMDYGITRDENLLGLRHQHNLSFGLFYIHHRGLFFDVEEEYLNQAGLIAQVVTKTNVWLSNASISYELPQKAGLLTFDIKNIFDRRYEFLSDPLSLDRRVPRRQVRFQFNVFF